MFALFIAVKFNEAQGGEKKAIEVLRNELILELKQVPGFVKGAWFADDMVGPGLLWFETEEQAKGAVQPVNSDMFGTTVISSEVYRVHAEA